MKIYECFKYGFFESVKNMSTDYIFIVWTEK